MRMDDDADYAQEEAERRIENQRQIRYLENAARNVNDPDYISEDEE